jgi:hypothetical protein
MWVWVPVSLLGFVTAGAAALGILTQGTSPATQLTAALLATLNARSYVSTVTYVPASARFPDPTERTVANAPNLLETIDNGTVTGIELRRATYAAIPRSCGTSAKFVEFPGESIGYRMMLKTLRSPSLVMRGLLAEEVNQIGNHYSLSRNGEEIESFTIRNGYVIQRTVYLSAVSGRHGLPNEVMSFSDIDHAPKIVVPPRDEVVFSAHAFICPVANIP